MSVYLDSSALVALYYPETGSAPVARAVGRSAIPFSFLHELELKNGLSLKKFRREASDAEINGTLRLVEEDRDAGRLYTPAVDWPAVWQRACDLSLRYSGTIGTRSLDMMHVALAMELHVSQFITLDIRQRNAARHAGLSVADAALKTENSDLQLPMRFFRPKSDDPFFNLALEDWLLDHAADFAPLLMFYVNAPSVVIGKNQVPWRECATARLRADGVPMARRISGGGTVYHDAGNLNYAFILPRDSYCPKDVFDLVLRALHSLGIEATVGANNGLFVDDRKFSGSAFCYRREHVLHHGTLLISADLEKLRRYCAPALPQISTRAIASKLARVVNLNALQPGLTAESVVHALTIEAGAAADIAIDKAAVSARAEELRGWDFLWGHTPKFEIQISDFKFQIERGVIAASELPELTGVRFDRDAMLSLRAAPADSSQLPILGKPRDAFFQALESLDF